MSADSTEKPIIKDHVAQTLKKSGKSALQMIVECKKRAEAIPHRKTQSHQECFEVNSRQDYHQITGMEHIQIYNRTSTNAGQKAWQLRCL